MNTTPTPSAEDDRCYLLELPPEIRLEIYRLALFEEEPEDNVIITPDGHARPPLFRTCKQIHAEALKSYYYERCFCFAMPDYNSDIILHFISTCRQLGLKYWKVPMVCVDTGDMQPDWDGLMIWMRRIHAAKGNVFLFPWYSHTEYHDSRNQTPLEDFVLGAMARMVEKLYSQPWKLVEHVLKTQRFILAGLNQKWGDIDKMEKGGYCS